MIKHAGTVVSCLVLALAITRAIAVRPGSFAYGLLNTPVAAAQPILNDAACAPTPTGIVGWWTGNGTTADQVGGNHGALAGDATYAAAVVGQGFKFDGVGDFVQIPDSPALRPVQVSVEAWVRFDSQDTPIVSQFGNPGLQYIVFKKNSRLFNFEGYALRKERGNDGVNRFVFSVADVNGFGDAARSLTPVTLGQFYHVVGTYDGTQVRIYVNGILEASAPTSVTMDYGTRPIFIGTSGETVFDGKLNGVVDEPSIYNRALSPQEVTGLFAAQASGKCSGVAPPTGLQTTVVGQQATLSWVAGAGTAPIFYILQAGSTSGASNLFNASVGLATTVTGTGLANGDYYWRVLAVTPAGTSAPSQEAHFVIGAGPPGPCTPGAPQGFTFSVVNLPGVMLVTLNWSPPAAGGPFATYVVEAGSAPGLANLYNADVGLATTLTANAPPGDYYVRIRAKGACGTGPASNEQLITPGTSSSTTTVTTTTTVPGGPPTTMPSTSSTSSSTSSTTSSTTSMPVSFSTVYANMGVCQGCHPVATQAAAYDFAFARSVAGHPEQSLFYLKPTRSGGTPHMGGLLWPEGQPAANAAANWINGGRGTDPRR